MLENDSFFLRVSPEVCSRVVTEVMGGKLEQSDSFQRQLAQFRCFVKFQDQLFALVQSESPSDQSCLSQIDSAGNLDD